MPLDHLLIDAHGGYSTSLSADPVSHAEGSSGGNSHHHRPPNHECPLNQRGVYDPADRRRPPFDGHPPYHRNSSASMPPPPSSRRAGEVPQAPGPPEVERYREHQHRLVRDESGRRSRSPRSHLPFRGSKSVLLPERHRLEDEGKESKSLPSSKRYRLEDGRKSSSSSRNWYDGELSGSRGRYGDGRHSQELVYTSSRDQEPGHLGDSSGRLLSRRESDISSLPSSPLIGATNGERYHEHQHHRVCDESGRHSRSCSRSCSPRFHSQLRVSKSVLLPKQHRLEDERKESKSLLSSKRYRLEEGRKGSSSGRNWYHDGELRGSRGRYADGRHTRELAYTSSCYQGPRYLGDSSGRLLSRREPGISSVPSSLLIGPTEGERYREHQDHCFRDESGRRSRSPHFHSPLRGSKSVLLPERHQLEDEGKESKSLPSSKRYLLEDGRKGSSSSRNWYDGELSGSRGRYGDGQHTQELGPHYLGDSKRNFRPRDHGKSVQHHLSLGGKLSLPMPMEMSSWDDGYKSPTSPTYRCEDGLHSESFSYDGSEIVGRDPDLKNEDLVLKKEEDSAYNALVDDFMDAVLKSSRNPNLDIPVNEEAHQKQADRYAKLALKRYNKNKSNKVKYSLVEAIVGGAIFEGWELYGHVNFYAKAKNGPKKNDEKVLVFAELHKIGWRPNSMVLTCFCLLDENNQLGGRRGQVWNSCLIQDQDMSHCYACTDRLKHPDGSCYKAGHYVNMLCYHH